jgi:hypothetical protein
MKAKTKFTVQEAETYIKESIESWREYEEHKIISLAQFAERRRFTESGPFTTMRTLKKSIRAIDLSVKRNEKVGIPSGLLDDQLEYLKGEYKELADKYGEPIVKPTKSKKSKAKGKGLDAILPNEGA